MYNIHRCVLFETHDDCLVIEAIPLPRAATREHVYMSAAYLYFIVLAL